MSYEKWIFMFVVFYKKFFFKSTVIENVVCKMIVGFVLSGMFLPTANAQKLDVAYVPTPDFVVEKMLDMAQVGSGDYLIDLGCGDGRINIAAAKRGAFGHGVDLDPDRINEARENAEKYGIADKVVFIEENIYDTDFSQATVIAMYLFPDINVKLRPKLLNNLEPGTRIVSHDFAMDEWKPDEKFGRMEEHAVLLWIVPARVEGLWRWKINDVEFSMTVNQKFQEIEPEILADGVKLVVKNSLLSGERLSFIAVDNSTRKEYVFSGKVEGDKIKGVVQIHEGKNQFVANWEAFLE